MKRSKANAISPVTNVFLNIVFISIAVICIYPVLLVLGISLSDERLLLKHGYSIIPQGFTFYAYEYVFKWAGTILNSYLITILVTVAGTVCSTFIISLFAYAISRREFRYRKPFSFFVLFTMLFNGGLVPWYIVCVKFLHLNNTIFALVLPYLTNAFYIIIMRTFFKTTVPDSIIESARIDGSGEFRTFFKIIIPLSLPGLATIALFITLQYWNDYFLPLMLITRQSLFNLQFMLYKLLVSISILQQIPNPNASDVLLKMPGESARMAMCILAIGPVILAYPFFQKYFIKGLTIGAIKG